MTNTHSAAAARIVVIDDHAMIAEALRMALDQASDLNAVGIAHTIADGIALVARTKPDVIITDLRLPEGDVVGHIPALRQASPTAKILIITGWSDEGSFLRAMGAGVDGFLDKLQRLDELVQAVRRSLRGELVIAPRFLPTVARRAASPTGDGELTTRELEILQLLARGTTTSEIAKLLHLSVNTVRNHVSRVLTKLGAHSRLEAVHLGVKRGLVRLSPE